MAKSQTGPVQINTPLKFYGKLPTSCDVVIIGGGVIGIFTALYLARAGKKVLVLEKGRIACEQSSRNWGWIRQHGRDRDELPIMMEASQLWESVDAEVGGRTGFKRGGVAYLASSEKKLNQRIEWLDVAREHQLDTRVLTGAQVDDLIDRTGQGKNKHQWVGATYTANDARAEPWQAVPAIAELAQDEGATLRENCAVRQLDISAGAVSGVITEAGPVRCDQVIVCAGAWSSLFLKRHGIAIPQLGVKSTVCQTEKLPAFFTGNAGDEDLAFRRREDGSYNLAGGAASVHYIGRDSFRHLFRYLPVLAHHIADTRLSAFHPKGFPDAWSTARNWSADDVSPFERMRVLNPEPNHKQVEKMQDHFAKRFPKLGRPKIVKKWAGMIDAMPDIVPIVDRVPGAEGVIVATGMSGHGFGIGPGFAKILARMVDGMAPGHDMSRFRFSRFTDGSRLRPGPDI